jgi:DUF4097 and DUF4098 domain-containing protein YvlB
MRTYAIVLLAIGMAATPAAAQIQIDKRMPAPPAAEVDIESPFGTVVVVGWDEAAVAVTGRLAPGVEELEFDVDEDGTSISVEVPEFWYYDSDDDTEYQSHIEIRVPRMSSLDIETLNASVTITGIQGTVEVETVNGAVEVQGEPPAVEIESVTGSVVVTAAAAEMDIETISGSITLRGAARDVGISTLSGAVHVEGLDFEEVDIESTAGDVTFEGIVGSEGGVEIETFSGNVELALPGDVMARFEFTTFGGEIQSDIGPRPRRDGRFQPYQELKFATGFNEFDISVETFNGNITLRAGGGVQAER